MISNLNGIALLAAMHCMYICLCLVISFPPKENLHFQKILMNINFDNKFCVHKEFPFFNLNAEWVCVYVFLTFPFS